MSSTERSWSRAIPKCQRSYLVEGFCGSGDSPVKRWQRVAPNRPAPEKSDMERMKRIDSLVERQLKKRRENTRPDIRRRIPFCRYVLTLEGDNGAVMSCNDLLIQFPHQEVTLDRLRNQSLVMDRDTAIQGCTVKLQDAKRTSKGPT